MTWLFLLACGGEPARDSAGATDTSPLGDSSTRVDSGVVDSASPRDSGGDSGQGTDTDTATTPCSVEAVYLDVPDVFPEGVDLDSAGTVYVGSLTTPTLYRAAPCEEAAEPWVTLQATTHGSVGLLVDEVEGKLWVCTDRVSGSQGPAVEAFELATGASVGVHPLELASGTCNDLARGSDGGIYVTESGGSDLYRLPPGAGSEEGLALWTADTALDAPGGQYGLNGIVALDGTVVVAGSGLGRLFQVPIGSDGSAGVVTPVPLDRDLVAPDGLELLGDGRLAVVEGKAQRVALVDLDSGTVSTLIEDLDFPTTAAARGDDLWVVESQLDHLTGQDPAPAQTPFEVLRFTWR